MQQKTSIKANLWHLLARAILAVLFFASSSFAAILNQPMTGATAPGWVIGGSAYLTASTGYDFSGDGWLRLTEPAGNQSGYAFYDSAFDISSGVVIQFDYATWGGNGADGYSIYLFDGAYNSATFNVGASGGSLGYDKKTVAPVSPGLSGGYLGVGIDEYGNFSSPTEGRLGGPGQLPNSVAVRGPYNHPSGAYYYIGGTAANVGTLWFNQVFRPSQTGSQYRKVVIYLTPVAAPQYMRVDVFMQFGYNQPLTYLINTLYTMRPIPASVKVGYAASTGGSTNYHEIRNLVINNLPTDINLAISKTASVPIVAPGGALTYTVTARNYGPNLVTVANNVPIVDTLPVRLTGATWTCVASGGGSCGAASGSGNLNTTATLPFNAAATYTITGTVSAATPLGTVLTNTATLSVPAGITDYNPADNSASVNTTVSNGNITISGTVYNDSGAGGGTAHNGIRDGTEAGATGLGANYYAKLFRPTNLTATVVAPVQVSAANGTYSFAGVPAYGDYVVILSSTNTANVFDPSLPSANWIYVSPTNYTLSGLVASGANLTNRNFFIYNGSRISGKVIKDDGFNGSISTAYDGILNAAETGIGGVTLSLRNNTGGTTYDTTTTKTNGDFVMFTNTGSATLRIYETNLAGYTSVSYNAGTTGGAYTIGGEYLQFAYTLYTDYDNILFGDVPTIITTFTPTPLSGNGFPTGTSYYAHTFNATGRGSVTFTTNSRTQGGWPAIAYVRDSNCNGSFDIGEPDIIAAVNAEAGQNICILVREAIPAGAVIGMVDTIVTRATFSAGLAPAQVRDVTDTTTIRFPILSTSTKTWIDLNGADQIPGDVLRYSITLSESGGADATNVSISDTIAAGFTDFSVDSDSIPAGATDASTPGSGPLSVTGITVPANGSVTILFDITIDSAPPGTTIDNTATINNPGGPGAAPVAPTVTVAASAIPGSGNKQLYLSAVPGQTLSRVPTTGATTGYITIAKNGSAETWTLSAPLEYDVTLDPATSPTVPVNLYMASNQNRNITATVTLACSAGGATLTQQLTERLNTTPEIYNPPFELPLNAILTCPAGATWQLTIQNDTTGGGTRDLRVYPLNDTDLNTAITNGVMSQVILPSSNVINVDSITPYSATYPDPTSPATYTVGSTVYLRAVVSDPFGSYDINVNDDATTLPLITITDSAGNATTVTNLPMTEIVLATTAGTKAFEYAYIIPSGALAGNWTIRVDAPEGTEGSVSDFGLGAMAVVIPPPPLSIIKWSTAPGAKPGENLTYWIQVDHSGALPASNIYVDDFLSPYLYLATDTYGPGVHINFVEGSPASGLSKGATLFSQTGNTVFGYTPASGNGGAPTGTDGNVTNWRQPLIGTMNPGGRFYLQFQVQVR